MQPVRVFVGYAREDELCLTTFRTYVADVERDNVEFFDDRDIRGGQNWKQILLDRLNTADIVVFLITPHFIRSEFCMDEELPVALDRQETGNCVILPVKVEPFVLREESPLANMQWIPSGTPITSYQGAARRQAWVDVAKKVWREVKDWRAGNLAGRQVDDIPRAPTRNRNRRFPTFLFGGSLAVLGAVVAVWLLVRPLDTPQRPGAAAPPAVTPTESPAPDKSDPAPPDSSCVAHVICRYLRLAPGQGFNLDKWRTNDDNPTVTLLGDGGLGVNSGTAKIAPAVELSRQPADPLPCPNQAGWTEVIPQVPYDQGVCVKTPDGKYFLLIHLEPARDQRYETFLAAGFPE